MTRRDLLQLAAVGGAQAVLAGAVAGAERAGFEWDEASVGQLQEAMAGGKSTSAAITQAYLDRIAALDRAGPGLRAILETNPDALAMARSLDQERQAGRVRGPLHGVPVILKDNIDTHDRMTTTAGSLALAGSIPGRDAFLVRRLREAGAVILGKANLSEWANFRSSPSSSGWSGRGGQTRNPYCLDRNPSGSSSGSAVAVSANLCPLAVGTETDGSIISPSAICGVVGIKPTVGLVSRSGIIPISRTQDTAGPMARSVRDAAILLSALAGVDAEDEATAELRGKAEGDYTKFLVADGLKGARLGVVRRFFRLSPAANAAMEEALAAMKRAGAVLVDPVEMPTIDAVGDAEFEVLLYEFKAGINAYLAGLGASTPAKSLEELIAFNERHREQELAFFGQETFIKAQAKGPLTEKAYLDAVEKCRRLSRVEGIDAVMEKHQLDALVAPSGGPAGVTDMVYGDRDVGGCTTPAAVAGYPSISVPAGEVMGLPVGMAFFGRAYSEPALLKIAYGFEQATGARRRPRFIPSLGG